LCFALAVSDKILRRDPREEMKKAFRLFCDEGSGKITLESLKRVARELNEELDDKQLQAMIDEFDLDGDRASKSLLVCLSSLWSFTHCPPLSNPISLSSPSPYRHFPLPLVNEKEFIDIMRE